MLHHVVRFAEQNLDSEPGFTTREIRWRIKIDSAGKFVGVIPVGDAKRGERTPGCPDMHNMNAGGRAHFLVESAQTAVLLFKPNETEQRVASGTERHKSYARLVEEAATKVSSLTALAAFLAAPDQKRAAADALAGHRAKPTDWIDWRIDTHQPLKDPVALDWWRAWRNSSLAGPGTTTDPNLDPMVCVLSGTALQPSATHPKVKGLADVGGLGTGDVVVGFDKAAFTSFGLEQSSNAAMSAAVATKYADGLSYLLQNHSQRLVGTRIAHWFKERASVADDPLEWLFDPPETAEGVAQSGARKLLRAVRTGERGDIGVSRYFAMTVSGAAGRVMVRDWMEGDFRELAESIDEWFDNLAITHREGARLAPDPKFLAIAGSLVRELADLPPATIAHLWRAAVARRPIASTLLAQAVNRSRIDVLADEPISHARMGLMKAYFVRKPGGDSTMTAYLNTEHPEPAYQCGRLLAVLANLQRAALGDVGAGVVQRYYVAASQTPGLLLGRLISNSKNHLGKLDGGLPHWYEDQIAEIMSRMQDRVPRTLDLEGQGLFALGYYQQIAALRAGKKAANQTEGVAK